MKTWCLTACPVNAIGIDPDTNAKVVMDDVCVGCAVCTVACPYGTMFYNPDSHKPSSVTCVVVTRLASNPARPAHSNM